MCPTIASLTPAFRIAPILALSIGLSGCVPTINSFVASSAVSNPDCDGSGVASSGGALSVGGTGGCVASISSALETEASQLRNSAHYSAQEITHSVGGSNYRSNSLIASRFEYAHALNLTGAEQIIAVHDSGFNATHLEFWDKSISYGNGKDDVSIHIEAHGTATAALAAGTSAYGQTLGGAPNATLYLSSWNDGDDHVPFQDAETLGAIVVNNSWGYECSGDAFNECGILDYSTSLITSRMRNALLDYAGDEGVVVFSASNEETQTQATFMAALPRLMPSLEEGWLAVINVARDYDPSEASLFDDSSVGLLSSGCLEAARWCVAADGTSFIANANWNDYEVGTGTSYAAPRVSAAIAILAEAFPNLSAQEIRNRLIMTSDNAFFAADTAQIQTLNFAGGLSHDYHWIYGHGFIDLRAALLPIGVAATTTARGDVLDLSSPVIVSAGGSGDAVASALSKVTLSASDQMGGVFEFAGNRMVATSKGDAKASRALNAFATFAQDEFLTMGADSTRDAGIYVPMVFGDGMTAEVQVPQTVNDTIGLAVTRTLERDDQSLSLGASVQHDGSSLLGLSLGSNGTISSEQVGVFASYETEIADGLSLGLHGKSGFARSRNFDFFDAIDNVQFNAIGASVSQSNAIAQGDKITFFASQPTAIRNGSASTRLNISSGGSGSHYATVDIPLAPSGRETELGIEYSANGIAGLEWSIKASRRFNALNVAGNDVNDVILGVRKAF